MFYLNKFYFFYNRLFSYISFNIFDNYFWRYFFTPRTKLLSFHKLLIPKHLVWNYLVISIYKVIIILQHFPVTRWLIIWFTVFFSVIFSPKLWQYNIPGFIFTMVSGQGIILAKIFQRNKKIQNVGTQLL